jgi:hypothetical protein
MEVIVSTSQKLDGTCRIDCGDVIVCREGDKIKGNVRLSKVLWWEHCCQVQDTVGRSLHWTQYWRQWCDGDKKGQLRRRRTTTRGGHAIVVIVLHGHGRMYSMMHHCLVGIMTVMVAVSLISIIFNPPSSSLCP